MDNIKRGRGRPRKITPHIARKIFILYGKGLTDHEIAEVFDLNPDTITELKKQADYSVTIKKIKQEADLKVVSALYQRAIGYSHPEEIVRTNVVGGEGDKYVEVTRVPTTKHYPPDTEAIKFWLMNRQRDNWRKEIQHEETRPKPAMVRVFEKADGREMAIITRGENQVDVLLGKEFVDQIKAEENGHHPGTNGNGRL